MSAPTAGRSAFTASGLPNPLAPLQHFVAASIYSRIGSPAGVRPALQAGPGDPGLFGPGSAVWTVHSDVAAMLIGGLSALMLQTLHPLAMAGVDQHSGFRDDPFSRLSATSQFIVLTSFGSAATVGEAIARVRDVHTRVRGKAPDGRSYSAGNPELLTWVHTALVRSFLASHLRYSSHPISAAGQRRYYDTYAVIAERLGARSVPRTPAEVRAYFQAVRPELKATPAALDTVAFLRNPPGQRPAEALVYPVIIAAAMDLLPEWARDELGVGRHLSLHPVVVRRAADALGRVMRWGVGTPLSVRWATERASAPGGSGAAA